MEKKVIVIIPAYFLVSAAIFWLHQRPWSSAPLLAYLTNFLLYVGIGFALCGTRAPKEKARGPSLWCSLGAVFLIVLLLPAFNISYQITSYCLTSHVEVFCGLILGVCISALTREMDADF